MTKRQLQTLISAGVFSAALLSGAAYADEAATGTATPAAQAPAPVKKKHKKAAMKEVAKHACKGQNACKGQGGCASS